MKSRKRFLCLSTFSDSNSFMIKGLGLAYNGIGRCKPLFVNKQKFCKNGLLNIYYFKTKICTIAFSRET